MTTRLCIVDDPLFDRHRAPGEHPERPERLEASRRAVARLREHAPNDSFTIAPPRDATPEELARVHSETFLQALDQAAGHAGYLDADTFLAPDSVAAARRAAGGALTLVDELLSGKADFGVGLLRPPGHHACPDHAMGFCLINNVAAGSAEARARDRDRVLVLDWDVHHGNGTQDIFYSDPSVLYVSLHQFPFYPGTGAAHECGEGAGTGYTVNVPLSAGADDAVYQAAFERVVLPIVEQYAPDLVLVSAGYDAHARDPLGGMRLTDGSYAWMTRALMGVLPNLGRGRLALLLEGGYDLAGLEGSVERTLDALVSRDFEPGCGADDLGGAVGSDAKGSAWAERSSMSAKPRGERAGQEAAPEGRHAADLQRAIRIQRQFWKLD